MEIIKASTGIGLRPMVQLSLPSRVPASRPHRGRATDRRYSPADSSSCIPAANTLDPFAMWPAFPTSDYYGSSAPPRQHRPTTDLPTAPPEMVRSGTAGMVPRSLLIRSTGSAPSYAPAASLRLRRRPSPRPPDQRHHPAQEFPAPPRRPERRRRDGAGARCNPAPIRQIRAGGSLERRSAAGSSRAPFRLACRARTIWQYWPASSLSGAASTLPGVSRIELPPASPRRYDDTAVKVSHLHSVQQRLGDPQLVGVLGGEVAFEQVRCHCAGGESASFLPCRRR